MLSQAGKEILLKTVAQAMPNYAMNVYLLLLDLCKDLERMINSFWWDSRRNGGGGINWMRWDSLCKLKSCGGIGFKRLYVFDVVMLGKQGWRLLTKVSSLVAKVLKAWYFPNSSFVKASLGKAPLLVRILGFLIWRMVSQQQS